MNATVSVELLDMISDIGTGNFIQTNYPELYAGGAYFVANPENEVYELDGGKVFYTSTDPRW